MPWCPRRFPAHRRRFGFPLQLSAGLILTVSFMAGTPALASGQTDRTERGPTASYLVGRLAQSEGDWAAASRYLAAALAADPADPALLRRTLTLALAQGDMKTALTLAGRLQQTGVKNYVAGCLLVADSLSRDRLAEARTRFADLPADGIGSLINPLIDAWLAVGEGDTARALTLLEPLGKAPGFAPLQQLQVALIQDLAGNKAEAAAQYDLALQGGLPLRLVQLVANFQQRQGNPDAAQALYRRFLSERPDSPLAAEALQRLGKERPKPLIPDAKSGLAQALFDVAAALQQENRSDIALSYGRISLVLRPDQPLARLLVAETLYDRERFVESATELQALIASPGQGEGAGWVAKLRLSDALRRLSRADEAAKLLTSMAAEQKGRSDALVRLGDLHRFGKREDAAIQAYSSAIARTANPTVSDWFLFYARALALDASKRWPEAEADLKRALQLKPDQPQVLNYLGYSWVDRGENLTEALALIERAVALKPDDGYIVDSLGWARFKLGDYHGALERLERAVELMPDDITINDHLGDALWAVGRQLEARFQWQRVVRMMDGSTDQVTLDRAVLEQKLKSGITLPRRAEAGP
jgi:tetratricopeptide (TPR) repeat protein